MKTEDWSSEGFCLKAANDDVFLSNRKGQKRIIKRCSALRTAATRTSAPSRGPRRLLWKRFGISSVYAALIDAQLCLL